MNDPYNWAALGQKLDAAFGPEVTAKVHVVDPSQPYFSVDDLELVFYILTVFAVAQRSGDIAAQEEKTFKDLIDATMFDLQADALMETLIERWGTTDETVCQCGKTHTITETLTGNIAKVALRIDALRTGMKDGKTHGVFVAPF